MCVNLYELLQLSLNKESCSNIQYQLNLLNEGTG